MGVRAAPLAPGHVLLLPWIDEAIREAQLEFEPLAGGDLLHRARADRALCEAWRVADVHERVPVFEELPLVVVVGVGCPLPDLPVHVCAGRVENPLVVVRVMGVAFRVPGDRDLVFGDRILRSVGRRKLLHRQPRRLLLEHLPHALPTVGTALQIDDEGGHAFQLLGDTDLFGPPSRRRGALLHRGRLLLRRGRSLGRHRPFPHRLLHDSLRNHCCGGDGFLP
mmetsp:Transcript_53790/g.149589  ORF Transcript_53790/g.149589 Transcript_53790/m.149589 type:complete len:223 (+) Transcript_53790:142-810(+)